MSDPKRVTAPSVPCAGRRPTSPPTSTTPAAWQWAWPCSGCCVWTAYSFAIKTRSDNDVSISLAMRTAEISPTFWPPRSMLDM